MARMRVVQPAVDEVIDMIAVGDSLVTAAGAMQMSIAALPGSAVVWVRIADLNNMLIGLAAAGVEQMAILQVVDMVSMAYSQVAAAGAMLVWGTAHAYLRA